MIMRSSFISLGWGNTVLLRNMARVLASAALLSSGVAQAALMDRGGGLLYDSVLNVTWLQDANFARTSGVDADGMMNWWVANDWVANLSFHDSVRHVDYSDWRLAANAPVGADWNYDFSYDGSTDRGYNITSSASELSYMYYVNLGLKGLHAPSGAFQLDAGVFGNGTTGGQANVGLVNNLQSSGYWYGTVYAPAPALAAWGFATTGGGQGGNYQDSEFYVWPVRPGDVAAAVPEPETYAMLLAGLWFVGVMVKRRRQSFGAS
jgi:hypothetical protein